MAGMSVAVYAAEASMARPSSFKFLKLIGASLSAVFLFVGCQTHPTTLETCRLAAAKKENVAAIMAAEDICFDLFPSDVSSEHARLRREEALPSAVYWSDRKEQKCARLQLSGIGDERKSLSGQWAVIRDPDGAVTLISHGQAIPVIRDESGTWFPHRGDRVPTGPPAFFENAGECVQALLGEPQIKERADQAAQ